MKISQAASLGQSGEHQLSASRLEAHDRILRCRINAAFQGLAERRIYAAERERSRSEAAFMRQNGALEEVSRSPSLELSIRCFAHSSVVPGLLLDYFSVFRASFGFEAAARIERQRTAPTPKR
jgi:hypothetical protein